MNRACLAAVVLAALAGCGNSTSSIPGSAHVVQSASSSQQAALLDRVKSLAGTWECADEKDQTSTCAVFAVTSAGSAVREVMFPGSPHEMTNVYHMDGPSLVMVHYCAQGNQPHMRAAWSDKAPADRIDLKFDGVTNYTASNQTVMSALTIVFKDHDHMREEWSTMDKGPNGHRAVFEMTRKK
jgi:hypothetical protein